MVKSFAHKINGPWLQNPTDGATSQHFNSEADPLHHKTTAANQTRDARRHSETTGGSDGGAQDTKYSKLAPVLKPRSQQGRGNLNDTYWLEAQYQDSLSLTKPRSGPANSPEQTPHNQPKPSPSQ